MRIPIAFALLFAAVPSCAAEAGTVRTELTQVQRKPLERMITIPGELKPFQRVDIHARVTGFVESIHVDRGSFVKAGQLLARHIPLSEDVASGERLRYWWGLVVRPDWCR